MQAEFTWTCTTVWRTKRGLPENPWVAYPSIFPHQFSTSSSLNKRGFIEHMSILSKKPSFVFARGLIEAAESQGAFRQNLTLFTFVIFSGLTCPRTCCTGTGKCPFSKAIVKSTKELLLTWTFLLFFFKWASRKINSSLNEPRELALGEQLGVEINFFA